VGPTPPRTRGRTPWEAHAADVTASIDDVRRRREFESGDAAFW